MLSHRWQSSYQVFGHSSFPPGARNTIQIHKCKPPHIYDTEYHETSFSNLYQYLRDGHSSSATMAYLCNATNTDVSLLYLENIILIKSSEKSIRRKVKMRSSTINHMKLPCGGTFGPNNSHCNCTQCNV